MIIKRKLFAKKDFIGLTKKEAANLRKARKRIAENARMNRKISEINDNYRIGRAMADANGLGLEGYDLMRLVATSKARREATRREQDFIRNEISKAKELAKKSVGEKKLPETGFLSKVKRSKKNEIGAAYKNKYLNFTLVQ